MAVTVTITNMKDIYILIYMAWCHRIIYYYLYRIANYLSAHDSKL